MTGHAKKRTLVSSAHVEKLPSISTKTISPYVIRPPHFSTPKHAKLIAKYYNAYGYWRDYLEKDSTEKEPSSLRLFALPDCHVLWNGLVFDQERVYTLDYFSFPPKEHTTLDHIEHHEVLLNLCWKADDYHHFLIETVPRLLLFRKQILKYKNKIKILWWYDTSTRYVKEMLQVLGFDKKMFINIKRKGTQTAYHADLVLLPFACSRDPRLIEHQDKVAWYSIPKFLRMTRKAILDEFGKSRSRKGPIVYVTRRDVATDSPKNETRGRGVTNEAEVISLLTKKYGDRVFCFSGSEHSLSSTVEIFSSARVIIGPHGGGLSNNLFLRDGSTVIEFLPAKQPSQFFYILSSCLNHEYWPLPIKDTGWTDSLDVPIKELTKILDKAVK